MNSGWTREFGDLEVAVDRGIDYTQIAQTVLIERNVQPDWIDKLRLAGAERIIITFDDKYDQMPESAKGKGWWDRYHGRLLKSLALADLLIVPSRTLLDAYRPYCKDALYVPNYVDDDLWLDLPPKPEDNRIGWGGSAEHLESWKALEIGRALKKVLAEHPDWQLFICSSIAPEIAHYLPKGLTLSWRPWVSHVEWPKLMSGFTIGIAPLNGQYDRYRSNLKLVEYGMGSVPWIATNYDPYTRADVVGGIIINNQSWYRALSEMIEKSGTRLALADQGHAWAMGYRMSQNVSVYENILWPA